jgi:hypothetical protein
MALLRFGAEKIRTAEETLGPFGTFSKLRGLVYHKSVPAYAAGVSARLPFVMRRGDTNRGRT